VGLAVGAAVILAVVIALVVGAGPSPSSTASPRASASATSSSAGGSSGTGGRSGAGTSGTPTTATARPFTVVALGDSVPTASTCGCTGYVELLTTRLGQLTGRPTVVHNDATDGWTTADVVDDLDTPSTKADLSNADLVVVEIGANDFDFSKVDDPSCYPAETSSCWSSTIAGLQSGLTQIVTTVKSLSTNPQLRVAVVGYWNVTVDGAVGRARGQDFVEGSDSLTRLVNATIARVAANSGATYVDAYTPLKGSAGDLDPTADLLDDGDHPNQAGHRLLMQAVLDTLLRAGAVDSWRRAAGQ
jgi:lysophospholipase L1-like esterase